MTNDQVFTMKIRLYGSAGSLTELEIDINYFPISVCWAGKFYLRLTDGYYVPCPCYMIPVEES
jgi:hypothetical protein